MVVEERDRDVNYGGRLSEARAVLSTREEKWRDRQPFLESKGIILRPRYHPDWVPSWKRMNVAPKACEDYWPSRPRDNIIDAIRIHTKKIEMVYLKRVPTQGTELEIITMLNAIEDSRKHTVTVLETFNDEQEPGMSYLVMPYLRLMDSPPFEIVENVIDFCNQILEGLVFMHEHGVAHRDCSRENLMMNASLLYPNGHHPVRDRFLPDAVTPAYPLPRSSAPLRYFYVDFGISVHIPPEKYPKTTTGRLGRDQEVPELSDDIPYDPFKVDIFSIGNMLKKEFHNKYSNVDFLLPLIRAMTQRDPAARPDAVEAFERWKDIRYHIPLWKKWWRLRPRSDPLVKTIFYDTFSLVSTGTTKLFGQVKQEEKV